MLRSFRFWAESRQRGRRSSGGIFDLYEIVPGFVFGLLAIVVVSLLTPAPGKEVTDEFDTYHQCAE